MISLLQEIRKYYLSVLLKTGSESWIVKKNKVMIVSIMQIATLYLQRWQKYKIVKERLKKWLPSMFCLCDLALHTEFIQWPWTLLHWPWTLPQHLTLRPPHPSPSVIQMWSRSQRTHWWSPHPPDVSDKPTKKKNKTLKLLKLKKITIHKITYVASKTL